MFDFNDTNNLTEFKKRFSEARRKKGYTQQEFAEALDDNDRSRVANWESKKSKTVPKIQDIPTICQLLDVDPNFLLGVSDVGNANDQVISEQIHLSVDNIRMLRNSFPVSDFVDFLLSSKQFYSLLRQINRIYTNGFFSESMESIFSPYAIARLEKAFNAFSREVFPIDMSVETFTPYVRNAFPWNEQKETLDDFVRSIVIDERYYDMLASNPVYLQQSMPERYDGLTYDFSLASFKHLMGNPFVELAEHEVSRIFSEIVRDYVDVTVKNFKKRDK